MRVSSKDGVVMANRYYPMWHTYYFELEDDEFDRGISYAGIKDLNGVFDKYRFKYYIYQRTRDELNEMLSDILKGRADESDKKDYEDLETARDEFEARCFEVCQVAYKYFNHEKDEMAEYIAKMLTKATDGKIDIDKYDVARFCINNILEDDTIRIVNEYSKDDVVQKDEIAYEDCAVAYLARA